MDSLTRALRNPVIALGIGFLIAGIALGFLGEQTSEITLGLAFLVVGLCTEFLLPKPGESKEQAKPKEPEKPAPPQPPQGTP